ncbi:MAG: peroxiredoxin [Desulfobulbaceae bacterium A2]|nr:MAG: peroxiredoxin [Desulfobulbaceae bacterium A2]
MANSLGIFVTNANNWDHVKGVVRSARNKGIKVKVFFTWSGTRLTQQPDFKDLCELADDVSICADSYKKMGFDVTVIPPGLAPEKMATQAQHGAIIEDYEKYLTL